MPVKQEGERGAAAASQSARSGQTYDPVEACKGKRMWPDWATKFSVEDEEYVNLWLSYGEDNPSVCGGHLSGLTLHTATNGVYVQGQKYADGQSCSELSMEADKSSGLLVLEPDLEHMDEDVGGGGVQAPKQNMAVVVAPSRTPQQIAAGVSAKAEKTAALLQQQIIASKETAEAEKSLRMTNAVKSAQAKAKKASKASIEIATKEHEMLCADADFLDGGGTQELVDAVKALVLHPTGAAGDVLAKVAKKMFESNYAVGSRNRIIADDHRAQRLSDAQLLQMEEQYQQRQSTAVSSVAEQLERAKKRKGTDTTALVFGLNPLSVKCDACEEMNYKNAVKCKLCHAVLSRPSVP